MSNPHNVQPYTADDLNARIAEQSVDLNRLAATVWGMHATLSALADWANQQIAAATEDSGKRRK